MKKKNVILFALAAITLVINTACESPDKDLTPPVIDDASFLPADCDIYYLGDTIRVHFCCSDNVELGNFNIEIHNNFDHHTHGTSAIDCDGEPDDAHHHDEDHDEDHEHADIDGAWVFNTDYTITPGFTTDTVDIAIPVPFDILDGDYHFMLRLTDRAGWQTFKAVPIHIRRASLPD